MQLAQQVLQQHGPQLVYNVIHASVFQLPTNMLPRVADFLVNLVDVMKQVAYAV